MCVQTWHFYSVMTYISERRASNPVQTHSRSIFSTFHLFSYFTQYKRQSGFSSLLLRHHFFCFDSFVVSSRMRSCQSTTRVKHSLGADNPKSAIATSKSVASAAVHIDTCLGP